MGKLINGVWHDVWYDTKSTGGKFVRKDSSFRNWVTPDGAPGPSGTGGFKAEAGRYHLYVSYACPWAHRTLIFRTLKGLEDMISLSVVHPYMRSEGWTFKDDPKVIPDSIHGTRRMYEVYQAADPTYTGRVTVPVLWDKKTGTIVSNESSEIIRMFNSAFDGVGAKPGDYYPEHLRAEIDEINAYVYPNVNNGVYRAGFATGQAAYDKAVGELFDAMDRLDQRLASRRYLAGDHLTEADWRLFTTLVRFDEVYHGHFKCNHKRLVDYHNLWAHTRELYQVPGIKDTVHMDHIKAHYYQSHGTINPSGVVPIGPKPDFAAPHDRARLSKAA
jgi:putative glutathione S-transferase